MQFLSTDTIVRTADILARQKLTKVYSKEISKEAHSNALRGIYWNCALSRDPT